MQEFSQGEVDMSSQEAAGIFWWILQKIISSIWSFGTGLQT